MIPLSLFVPVVGGLLIVAIVVVTLVGTSRGFWKDRYESLQVHYDLSQSSQQNRRLDLENLIKRMGLVKEERDFWRDKAIQLGYPAAKDDADF